MVYQLTKELSKRGHEVSVLTTNAYFNGKKGCEGENGVIYRFELFSKRLSKQNIMVANPEFVSWVKKTLENYDCIHLHGYRNLQNIVIHHYAKKYSIPYVLQAHGTLPRIMVKQRLKWGYDVLFGYRLLRDASKVIALSRMEAEQYRGMGVPEEKIAVIPNGIDLSEYADLPPKGSFKKKFGIDDDEKIVLYLGRIHWIKGIDILVKAFANVIKKLDNIRLVIVGPDDGYLSELQALIKALRIENKVIITGPLYGRDKIEVYVDADVYVLPSRYETFPMTLLEVYACAKPVVASKVGKSKDLVIDNVTGLSVEPVNAEHLASAILYLLNNDDKAEEMGLRGKQFVKKNFAIEKVVDKLERLYEDIINNKSHRTF